MDQKTAVITGGAQGIGKIVAQQMLKSAYSVAILDIDSEALAETEKDTLMTGMIRIQCDVSEEDQVKKAIVKILDESGRIDVLVNNAAIGKNVPVEDLDLREWNRVLAVNLTGPLLCTKHCIPFLRKTKGAVINIASTRALMSEPHTEAYSASKGGIAALTHALAVSLGPDIRVNCISPGWIEVSQHKKSANRSAPALTDADHMQHPAGRVGNAYDIARMVLFLADPENNFITGQNFIVDGGMTRRMIYV